MIPQSIDIDDIKALQQTCTANVARIDAARDFLAPADGNIVGDDFTPEALIALADDLDDPEAPGRPALLRWNTVLREHRSFDTGA